MTLDSQTIVQLVFAGVLIPAFAGWLLARWLSRGACAVVTGVAGGVLGTLVEGPELGLFAAACWAGVAYVASRAGFVPTSLEEAGRLVKDSPRRWWR